jgi:hypothetical protein
LRTQALRDRLTETLVIFDDEQSQWPVSQWTESVIGSFAWRPGVFEPESDGGQRLVESFDDVDAATFVDV